VSDSFIVKLTQIVCEIVSDDRFSSFMYNGKLQWPHLNFNADHLHVEL
jgi:hypothetical protein